MLRLYKQASGAQDVELVQEIPACSWSRTKRNLIRLLQESFDPEAVEALEKDPFELWEATNNFQDEFNILYLRTSARRYLELEAAVDGRENVAVYRRIAETMGKLGVYIRFIGADVADEEEIESVAAPKLAMTSGVVEYALNDAEALIRQRGPVSGLDRVHTVFHGYLRVICEEAGLLPPGDPDITTLFKIIRTKHPALQPPPPSAREIDSILGPMATIVNALNPLRNRGSVAHPNDSLLEEPEAMLVINAVRTLLHYLNSRIKPAQ